MGVPPPANIDMDVDFDAEIKPHLRACLVSALLFSSGWLSDLLCSSLHSRDAWNMHALAQSSAAVPLI